jgi:hypothetical protein
MVELAEKPRKIDVGSVSFFEAAYLHKRQGKYYISYSNAHDAHYGIGDSPYGPFVYKCRFAKRGRGSIAHPAIIEYKGQWYYFYQRGDYTLNGVKGSMQRRNVCVDELYYNADGTIKEVKLTNQGVKRNTQ